MNPSPHPKSTTTRRKPRPGSATEPTQTDAAEFAQRRLAFRRQVGNAVIVLEANTEAERGELRSGFFQDPNFYYLSGWNLPGAMLILAPADRAGTDAEILILPDRDPTRTLWSGALPDATDQGMARLEITRLTGIRRVERRAALEAVLSGLLGKTERLACLAGSGVEQRLRQLYPFREIIPAGDALAQLRMRKAAPEIARLRAAIDITAEGQLRGWRSLQTAASEYEVAADITHEFLRRGAERHAFAPIVAAGENGCVLHYSRNRSPLKAGTLAILDVGAERDHYAGDLTRTVPVGGRFSKRQRVLYDAVLSVQKEILRAVRPGAMLARQVPGSLHQQAAALFSEMRIGPKRKPLSEFFPHGIGHHLGLDVHDLSDPLTPLAPGMVITIEPGVYIPEEGIGIRIEDNVLVTASGAEVLSSALPKEAADVEAFVRP